MIGVRSEIFLSSEHIHHMCINFKVNESDTFVCHQINESNKKGTLPGASNIEKENKEKNYLQKITTTTTKRIRYQFSGESRDKFYMY